MPLPVFATAAPNPDQISLMSNVLERIGESWVIAGVLLVLTLMSLFTWFIIVYKSLYFWRVKRDTRAFIDAFWETERLEALFEKANTLRPVAVAQVFKAGYKELSQHSGGEDGSENVDMESIERAMRRARMHQTLEFEKLTPFLATTGSAAPFIGLFGTVWGIMDAFAHIDPTKNLLTSVAPHIAEALVATAIGLLAAIPAVMAYNFFVRRIRWHLVELDNFVGEFLNIVRRHMT